MGGLGRLAVAIVVAGVLVAGLLLPYAVGAGLASNKITDAIENTPVTDMDQPAPERTTVTAADGTTIATVYNQNRVNVPLSEINPKLQNAIIATEDRRFYEHPGVDWRGTTRALLKNSEGTLGQQGGSTLTQQYVKNYRFLVQATTEQEKADAIAATPLRKLQEAKIALVLEQQMSKADILERYLNLVAFGPSVYGAEAAAQYFFGSHAKDLNLAQSALLAGMVNNPNKYNPFNPDRAQDALNRRNTVLDLMYANGYITAKDRDASKAKSLGTERHPQANGCLSAANAATNGYFCTYALDYLENTQGLSSTEIASGGYTVRTTMDVTAMRDAVAAVKANADPAKFERVANVMAVVQPGDSRQVLALAANRPFGLDQEAGQTQQRLTTTFAPFGAGSTFKIFTSAVALEKGLGTNSVISSPAQYTSPLTPTHPFNNSGDFPTSMTMEQALATSPNTAFVSLEDQVGLENVAEMAVRLGLRGYLLPSGEVDRAFAGTGRDYEEEVSAQKIASFTLGVSPVSPLELANVGATLASDGKWCQPTPIDSILDRNGNVVPIKEINCEQAVEPGVARALSQAMQADHRNDQGYTGTAYAAATKAGWKSTAALASKTGTTEDYKSAAFLGWTPYYSGAVVTWDYLSRPTGVCINDDNTLAGSCQVSGGERTGGAGTKGMSGGSVPANTWFATIGKLQADIDPGLFPPAPAELVTGTANTLVPDVRGQLYDTAKAQLEAAGFVVPAPRVSTTSGGVANLVVEQSPLYSALPGATVTLTVSAGATSSGG
ncbi:transglycosylase domain-containing protein [Nakamurella alba]|nr:transglycosylase domain-containing protein [Nakamurella alba]